MDTWSVYVIFGATFFGVCHGRGGTRGGVLDVPEKERTYPSMKTGQYYYSYYIKYFEPSGFYYARRNLESVRTVHICTNYEPYFNNGTYLGEFPCPMEKDPAEFTHCCGDNGYEYCCKVLDSRSVRIGIGFASATALGLLIGIIACIVLRIRKSTHESHMKNLSKRHMGKKGIPTFEYRKTKNYTAKQSIDGYQILVVFKKKKFYQRFYEELRLKYVDISWRYDDTDLVTEGKISLDDENWVNLVLCDDFEGSPVIIVMRERPSVTWMSTHFEELCAKIPDEKALFGCCMSDHRTHPTPSKTVKPPDNMTGVRPKEVISVRDVRQNNHHNSDNNNKYAELENGVK